MRNNLILLLATTAIVPMTASPVWAQPPVERSRTYSFNQPAQELETALIAFSRVTDLQVASSTADLESLRGAPLNGSMTASAALAELTRGLPVDVRLSGRTVSVSRRPGAPAALAQAPTSAPIPAQSAVQTTSPSETLTTLDEVVVTGFRSSLSRALSRKKAATGSQEVILAEDIGAFPDQNLAEALQRVPGVAITRDSGEGRQISLRGLGPDFTRTQLNGMEVLSNTASGMDSRSGASRSRSFDYSVFASELFNQVVVEKSYAAEQDEGGIGGTVSLRTAKPFDYQGRTFVANAKVQSNQYTDTPGPRLVALASDRWGDFGALVSVAYSSAETVEWGYRNWNWSKMNVGAANVGADPGPIGSSGYLPLGNAHDARRGRRHGLPVEPEPRPVEKEGGDRVAGSHPGRGYRRLSRPEPGRGASARTRRGDHARQRRRPTDFLAGPGPRLHPHPVERHGGAQ